MTAYRGSHPRHHGSGAAGGILDTRVGSPIPVRRHPEYKQVEGPPLLKPKSWDHGPKSWNLPKLSSIAAELLATGPDPLSKVRLLSASKKGIWFMIAHPTSYFPGSSHG